MFQRGVVGYFVVLMSVKSCLGCMDSFSDVLVCFFFCFFFSGELGAVRDSDGPAEGGCRAGGGLVIVVLSFVGP